ncbi:hypothetical protein LTR67_004562 [Exophiala xenobiotica]
MAVHRLTPVIDPPELVKESSVAGPGLWNHSIDITGTLWGSAEKGGKLTIYVNWPLSQWHTICFLSLLGIDYYTTWPGTPGAEKDRIYAKFNDKEDPVKILIVNLRSSAVGLNVQNSCAKILIMDMADNINIIIQAIGRVHRFGQLLQQCIWILCLNYTYDQWLWANAITKMMSQIVGEAKIDKPELTQTDIEQAMEAMGTMDEAHVMDTVSSMEDTTIKAQALDYIRRLMGARTDRPDWRTEDLAEPHRQQDSDNAPITPRRHDHERHMDR